MDDERLKVSISQYKCLPGKGGEIPDLEKRTVLCLGLYIALLYSRDTDLQRMLECHEGKTHVFDKTFAASILNQISSVLDELDISLLLRSMLELEEDKRIGYEGILATFDFN